MRTILLTLDREGISDKKRQDTDNLILRQAKIKMLAYRGAFDGLCTEKQIIDAKMGYCPHGYSVHHIIPLNCKNTSFEISNMLVIDYKTHTWLHNNIYTPALLKCRIGQDCSIFFPDHDPNEVMTWDSIQPFVLSFEAQRKREQSFRDKKNGHDFLF